MCPATTKCLDSDMHCGLFLCLQAPLKRSLNNDSLIFVQPIKYLYIFMYGLVLHTLGLMSMMPCGSVASIHCGSTSLAGQKWRMRYSTSLSL